MINELNEKMKEYPDKYFIKEFKKCKPSTTYRELEYEFYVLVASLVIVWIGGVVSLIFGSCAWPHWFWKILSMGFCSAVFVWLLLRVDRRKTNILFEMACAYLEKYSEIKEKLHNSDLLTTPNLKKQYIHSVKKAYRAEIVRKYLGNSCNVSAIKALKDEIMLKNVEFDLGFFPLCSLLALSIAFVEWKGFDFQNGWIVVLRSVWVLSGIVVFIYFVKRVVYYYKSRKNKELRETLEYMLYEHM